MPLIQKFPIRPIFIYLTPKNLISRSPHHHLRTMATLSQLQTLQNYTACDISDALLKLKVPNCGFLPDLNLYTKRSPLDEIRDAQITIAPASTVLFTPRNATEKELAQYQESNIPYGSHWVDLTTPESIVVISQPKGQICAVLGGIMALRMSVLDARGVIAWGRVRDVEELRETGLPVRFLLLSSFCLQISVLSYFVWSHALSPLIQAYGKKIWAKGTSITGTGAQASPHAIQVPLNLDGTIVNPGDLVFSDAVNGVIVIPKEKVGDVVEMLPKLVQADDRVKEEVKNGMTVKEAFKKHRE